MLISCPAAGRKEKHIGSGIRNTYKYMKMYWMMQRIRFIHVIYLGKIKRTELL